MPMPSSAVIRYPTASSGEEAECDHCINVAASQTWAAAFGAFKVAEALRDAIEAHDDEGGRRWDAAADVAATAEDDLLALPAPSIAAAAEKMRLCLKPQVEELLPDYIDDPRTISTYLALSDFVVHQQLRVYQDLLRMAGLRPEVAAATPFDPEPFIRGAEAMGYCVSIDELGRLSFLASDESRQSLVVPRELEDAFAGLRKTECFVIAKELSNRKLREKANG